MKCGELNELHFSSERQSLRFISKEIEVLNIKDYV